MFMGYANNIIRIREVEHSEKNYTLSNVQINMI